MRLTPLLFLFIASVCRGGRPRVYNALISTNQELLPSRAYPAVSPVISQPVYLTTSSVEIHHKQPLQPVDTHQHYPESPYDFQGQEIEQYNYDSYDDHQFQGYGREGPVRQEVEESRSNGQLLQGRPNSSRRSQETERHSARPPAHQNSRGHFGHHGYHHEHDEEWEDDEPVTTRKPVTRTQAPRVRPKEKVTVATPTPPPPLGPGLPPVPKYFIGGIPLNNQPDNIPVVPPPPIPIRG